MISGACSGFIVTAKTGSPYLGILAAIIAGAAMASIHAFMVVTRGANQLASGLALMFLGLGLTAYLGRPYVSEKINGLMGGGKSRKKPAEEPAAAAPSSTASPPATSPGPSASP